MALTVTTSEILSIETTTAIGRGFVTGTTGTSATTRGVAWKTSTGATTGDTKTINGSGFGAFSGTLTGLTLNTKYYVRAYATNNSGATYGNEVNFTTLPVVTTTSISSIGTTTATGGGNVTAGGGATISVRGVAWKTSTGATTGDTHTTQSGATGSFTSSLTGLTVNTKYYVRAYVANATGIEYGSEVNFTTLPSVTTTSISSIEAEAASGGGNVTAGGGATINVRGVAWKTSTGATTGDTRTIESGATGSFTSSLTRLSSNTKYYVRAYASNVTGIVYGSEVNFTTLPSVSTTSISSITHTTATGGGNVTAGGGATINARGVAWDTRSGATTGNTHTTQSGATGSFSSSLTGLTINTKYYVRAYATNITGIGYGSDVDFTTIPQLSTVTTTPASDIAVYTANSGGGVTGSSVTYRGIAWNSATAPTTGNSFVLVTGTTGEFVGVLTGLSLNRKYYIRAFAVNADGIAYGNEVSFTTLIVENQYTSSGYDFYYKTGLGDGAAYSAYLAYLEQERILHEGP